MTALSGEGPLDVLQVMTTAAVVVGVVFGLFEVRQAFRARREARKHQWIDGFRVL